MSVDLDSISKATQILFYLVASSLAVLTFVKAKNGLLNTVNTEFQKHVIEKLREVSEELYSEFDLSSESSWVARTYGKELLRQINKRVDGKKDQYIGKTFTENDVGIPGTAEMKRLSNLARKYRSDPFIPENIRLKILTLLETRERTLIDAYVELGVYYLNALGEGKFWEPLSEERPGLHNIVNEYMYKHGVGIGQVEEKVHEIRLDIQRYFLEFNPFRIRRRSSSNAFLRGNSILSRRDRHK